MMKEILEVKRGGGTYSTVATGNVIDDLKTFLPADRRVIVITEAVVLRHHGRLIDGFEKIVIPVGEGNKTLNTVYRIYSELLAMGADRSTFLLGFGGGIVTDITGFVASTYMRGLNFGFVATTLLSQVDASVGGKNGVNFEGYKNIIGTFNQPDFVLCDISLLRSLPPRELHAGMAEMIKSGLIADKKLFALFEKNTPEKFMEDDALLFEALTRTIKVKKRIVERDEREHGERKKLNLGHTFAHAIEKSSKKFVHGEAVAAGLAMAADISMKEGLLSPEDAGRIKDVLRKTGLPTESGIALRTLLRALRMDKKKEADSVNLILMEGIGNCLIRKYSFDRIAELMAEPSAAATTTTTAAATAAAE